MVGEQASTVGAVFLVFVIGIDEDGTQAEAMSEFDIGKGVADHEAGG